MNTRIIKIFVSLGLFMMLTGIALNAQGLGLKLMANIPFDFVYGDVAMPAGEYDITKLNMAIGTFRVRDQEGKNVAVRTVTQVERSKAPTETILVFNRYRENGGEVSTFLSQIWVEGDNRGFEFFKHRAEREAAARAAKRDTITLVVHRTNDRAD